MGISSAVSTAFSGLRAAQAGLDVVSQNVANSGTVGYTRRVLTTTQQVANGVTTGVNIGGATRVLDTLVQKQLRLETSGAAYTGTVAATHTALDALIDTTSGSNVASLVDAFSSSLQGLVGNPSSYAVRAGTVTAATNLASALHTASDGIQSLRQEAEDGIGQSVTAANGILVQMSDLNAKLTSDPTSAALQDQRDGLVDQLSQYMDVKVGQAANGSFTVSTTAGLLLFDGTYATKLSFDPHPVSASSTYSGDPSARTVGTITATDQAGITRDVVATGGIRSGQIAAYLDLRDQVLPEAQLQVDTLAASLAGALSDKPVAGTAAGAGAATGFDLDLSTLSNGNRFTLSYTENGATRTVNFVKTGSAAAAAAATASGTGVVGIDFSGGNASVASQVQAKLGSGFSVSNSGGATLRVLDDGAAGTTDVSKFSAAATVTGVATGAVELPLFVDGNGAQAYTGSFDGRSQLTGFASRIGINAEILADNTTLVKYAPATLADDTTRPTLLAKRLDGTIVTAAGAVGIGGTGAAFSGTLSQLASGIISSQASAANAATSLDSGQKIALNAVSSRFSTGAGVNIDTELTQLIELQTAYSANARVITAGKDMLDMLLRIGA